MKKWFLTGALLFCLAAGGAAKERKVEYRHHGNIQETLLDSLKEAMPLFKGMAKETDFRFCRVYRMKDFEIATKIAADPAYEKIITHVLPADEAQKGFDLLTTPGTGAVKVMFRFD